jgi:hypothetical protein
MAIGKLNLIPQPAIKPTVRMDICEVTVTTTTQPQLREDSYLSPFGRLIAG